MSDEELKEIKEHINEFQRMLDALKEKWDFLRDEK